jgi:hypothetical protein
MELFANPLSREESDAKVARIGGYVARLRARSPSEVESVQIDRGGIAQQVDLHPLRVAEEGLG